MSKEDREFEKHQASVEGLKKMISLLKDSRDPRFSDELLDGLIAAADESLRLVGEAVDLLKDYKRTRWPSDDWRVKWASRRERVELEREQNKALLKELVKQLGEARATGPSIGLSPEAVRQYDEILDDMVRALQGEP